MQHWFTSLSDAEQRLRSWRDEYNNSRLHSGLASMVVAAEDIETMLETFFRFAAALYEELDPFGRHSRFLYNVALVGLAYRTIERNPVERQSHPMNIMQGEGPVLAFDAPRVIAWTDGRAAAMRD